MEAPYHTIHGADEGDEGDEADEEDEGDEEDEADEEDNPMGKTRPGLDGFTLKAVGFSIQYFRGVHEIRTLQCSINNCLYFGLFLRTEKTPRQPINPKVAIY